MKKNNKILLIAIGIVFTLIILISIIFIYTDKNNINNQHNIEMNESKKELKIDVYYLDNDNNKLFSEKRNIEINSNIFNELINLMKDNPKAINGNINIIPENLNILSYELDEENKVIKINFSEEYNDMKETEKIFFCSAFVWTITGLPNIQNVEILIESQPIKKGNGEEIGILNRENIVLNPKISPEKIDYKEVILYFVDEEELGLAPEKRLIEIKQSQSLETQIVEQLILGPKQKGYFLTVPSETKIRNIKTEGGICYVDLSSEFVTKHTGGSMAETFAIYSIVNSLTELEEVNKVQFLIEGEKVQNYKGSIDISTPLDRKDFKVE